jgi:acetyl-CoA carboxylase carboxyl transferase subunit beta
VIQDTVRETLPDQFQTAEYVKDHGGIDLVVERQYLNSTIGTLLKCSIEKSRVSS